MIKNSNKFLFYGFQMETTIIKILKTSLFGNLHLSEFLFEILFKYFHIQYGIVLHNFAWSCPNYKIQRGYGKNIRGIKVRKWLDKLTIVLAYNHKVILCQTRISLYRISSLWYGYLYNGKSFRKFLLYNGS